MHTYSTTEHKVGTWIDGSDLYEKTIHVTTSPTQGNPVNIDSTLTVSNVGYLTCTELSYLVDGTFRDASQNFLEVGAGNNGIMLDRNNAPAGLGTITDAYVTIRYTKVTS